MRFEFRVPHSQSIMLHQFLTSHRNELIQRCRGKAAKRASRIPSTDNNGVPLLLQQIVNTLCREQSTPDSSEPEATPVPTAIGRTAALHGAELLRNGYTVDQVVHEYGDVCQAVTELAGEENVPVTIGEFHTLNRCLDDAIADAVTAYTRSNDSVAANERQHLIDVAIHAFSAIQTGKIGLTGATATVLATTLYDLRKLLAQPPAAIPREIPSHGMQG
jgi:hypothetical protein